MKFLCGSCRTKYQISDEKVRGKILTIRCKKCGAKILVRESMARQSHRAGSPALAPVADAAGVNTATTRTGGSAALAAAYEAGMESSIGSDSEDMPTSIAPVPTDAGLAGFEWYVAIDGQQHGPYAFAELVGKVQRGEIIGRHYVWHDGMGDWARVRDTKDLLPYLGQKGPKSTPPPPPPAEKGADVLDISSGLPVSTTSAQDEIEAPPEDISDEDTTQAHQQDVVDEVESMEPDNGEVQPSEPATTVDPEPTHPQVGGSAAIAMKTIPEGAVSLDPGEDIFANVPRASEEELVRRESTKFFVAAAGVTNEKKRNRLGTVIGLAAALGLLVFVGLWAGGIIKMSLPGIGNPFAGAKETTAVLQDTGDVEDDGNYALLVEGVKIGPAEGARSARRRRPKAERGRRHRSVNDKGPLQGLPSEYIDEEEADTRSGPRSLDTRRLNDTPSVSIRAPGTRLQAPEGLRDISGPQAEVDIPPPDVEALDATTIQRVVSSKTSSVRLCYERSLKAQERLQGKLQVSIVVNPSGRVTQARIISPAFKGSVVGKCIQGSIKNWRFPRFAGRAQEIELPFVFQRGG